MEKNNNMKKERQNDDCDINHVILKDLKWEDYVFTEPPLQVSSWNFIQIEDYSRLYYHIYDSLLLFCGIRWKGTEGIKPMWGPDTYIEILFVCTGFFDGLRHLYFGEPDGGYLFCPIAETLGRLLIEMDKIWVLVYEKMAEKERTDENLVKKYQGSN